MSEARQILVVDQQLATLDFMRSILPLVEDEVFAITRVPSAEEGLLELRRKRFDLLIAGLSLPGMDGLELARRTQRLQSELPIILVSQRPLAEWRDAAEALGVARILRRPLDAEDFLTAVKESLKETAAPGPEVEPDATPDDQAPLSPLAKERLESLCAETGASQVLLVSAEGEMLYATSGRFHPDLPRLVAAAAASFSASLRLANQLSDQRPRVVQFIEGQTSDLYWVNVDREHFLVILFDAQYRRGRIGTVWVFAQRATTELRDLLASRPAQQEADATSAAADERPDTAVAPAQLPDAAESGEAEPAESAASEPGAESGVAPAVFDPQLDAFWEEALANETSDDFFTQGITLEQARQKGLIAPDFDPDSPASDPAPDADSEPGA